MTEATPHERRVRDWRGWRLAPAVMSVGCLGAGVWWSLGQGTPTVPRSGAAAGWLGLGIVLYGLVTVLRAERWLAIIRSCGMRPDRADTYGLITVGYMGNNVLPARGGEVLRVLLLSKRIGAERRRVLGTLVVERGMDAAALGVLFLAFSIQRLGMAVGPDSRLALVGGVLAAAAAGAAAVLVRANPRAARRAVEFARPVWAATAALRGWRGVLLLGLSLILWVIEAVVYLAVAEAIGFDLGFDEAIGVMAFTNFVGILPAGPGYIGTFDAAVLVAIRAFGARGGAPVSYLLLIRFILFVPITLVGLGVLVIRYGGWRTLRSQRGVGGEQADAVAAAG